MKSMKSIVAAGIFTLGVFGLTIYSSCSKNETPDPCANVTCQNGGTCVNGSCKCPEGYEGADCSVKAALKFIGSYNAADDCNPPFRTGDSLNYIISITPNTDAAKIDIINLANNNNLKATATIHGDSISIPAQQLSDNRTYTATGKKNADGTISFKFQITKPNDAENYQELCTTVLTRI